MAVRGEDGLLGRAWWIARPVGSGGSGYRFKGIARVHGDGALFDEILAFFRKRGVSSPIKHIVVIQVERALALVSPAYDSGATEEEVRGRWQEYWRSIKRGDSTPTGE